LIETRNGVGNIVKRLPKAQARQIYDMRIKLAELIGVLTPKSIDKAQIEVLKKLMVEAVGLCDVFDIRRYFEINHQVHYLVAQCIGNVALLDMWHQLYFQTAQLWYGVAEADPQSIAETYVQELTDLHQAFERLDAIAIGHVQRDYITAGFLRVMDFYED
jgi:DNA-binding GntR family transcriptional regulator